MSPNTCIRVLADPVQIRECKQTIHEAHEEIATAAAIFNLAGNKVRLKILYLLKKEQEMCPCDLSDVLDMTVPAISQHLRKMKEGNLVIDRKVGQTVFYSVVEGHSRFMDALLLDLTRRTEEKVKDYED